MVDITALESAIADAMAHPSEMLGVCMTVKEAQAILDVLKDRCHKCVMYAQKTPRLVIEDTERNEFKCPYCGRMVAGRTNDGCIVLETPVEEPGYETPCYCWYCGQRLSWLFPEP